MAGVAFDELRQFVQLVLPAANENNIHSPVGKFDSARPADSLGCAQHKGPLAVFLFVALHIDSSCIG